MLDANSTRIVVGRGELERGAEVLGDWLHGRTVFVVSSPRVRALHGGRLRWLDRVAARRHDLEVPEGEAAKTVAVAEGLWNRMLEVGGKRDSRLLAFGGGSVGDLGGFVAGSFLRGIEFAQLPTTLLAQVDAALGGKTGVDLAGGKNTVGVFHHPFAVLSDVEVLSTLPPAELRSGLVEVVKMAFLLDLDLLARVERDLPALLAGEASALLPVVQAAADAKMAVVRDDPREGDRRRLLNFGHTLGHALEAALGYRTLRHGEAVAYGMLFALRLAERRGLDGAAADRLRQLLAAFELPPLPGGGRLVARDLVRRMGRDKKAVEAGLVWVLPAALGAGQCVADVSPREVEAELAAFLAAGSRG
ncbi:MAG: 3-dehydroquinate synthase family protein [Acidobacteriota bacterium]